jgi:hypothetical protein
LDNKRHNRAEVFRPLLVGISFELLGLLHIPAQLMGFPPMLPPPSFGALWEDSSTLQNKAGKTNAQSNEQSVNDLLHENKDVIDHIFQAEQQR